MASADLHPLDHPEHLPLQVLSDDPSCDDAVDRFQKFRYDQELPPVTPKTSSSCEARQRLPERVFWISSARPGIDPSKGERLMALSGATGQDHRRLHRDHAGHAREPGGIPPSGHPKARPGVSDRAAPRGVQPRRGHGARSRVGPCQGKPTSELALLRTVIAQFQPGDIVLADRFFCSYWVIAALQARGVDVVVRLHQRRTADSRRGRRLGQRTPSSPGPNRHRSPTGGAAPRTTRGPPS